MKKLETVVDLFSLEKVNEGIYFSGHSGKFFEAVEKKGFVRPKYTCGGYGPKVPSYTFKLQCKVLDYELIMEYEK